MSNSHHIILFNLVATTAADSSRRGVCLDFPIKNAQWASPSSFTTRRYVTAPYPSCDASAKLCTWLDTIRSKFLGYKLRLTVNCSSLGSSCSQSSKRVKSSDEILSSQSNLFRHRSRRIIFAGRISGATNPSGS